MVEFFGSSDSHIGGKISGSVRAGAERKHRRTEGSGMSKRSDRPAPITPDRLLPSSGNREVRGCADPADPPTESVPAATEITHRREFPV